MQVKNKTPHFYYENVKYVEMLEEFYNELYTYI